MLKKPDPVPFLKLTIFVANKGFVGLAATTHTQMIKMVISIVLGGGWSSWGRSTWEH